MWVCAQLTCADWARYPADVSLVQHSPARQAAHFTKNDPVRQAMFTQPRRYWLLLSASYGGQPNNAKSKTLQALDAKLWRVAALLHGPDAKGGPNASDDDAASVVTASSAIVGLSAGHVVGLPSAHDLDVRACMCARAGCGRVLTQRACEPPPGRAHAASRFSPPHAGHAAV